MKFKSSTFLSAVICLTAISSTLPFSNKANAFDLSRVMIDMSHHNKDLTVNGDLRVDEGILQIVHRATIGKYDKESDFDRQFEQRAREAHNSGILFGAYHLPFPSSDGTRQANDFIQQISKRCIDRQQMLLAIDWEDTKGRNGRRYSVDPQFIQEFSDQINKLTGKRPIIYTNLNYLKKYRGALQGNPEIERFFSQHPLWLAQYSRKFSFHAEPGKFRTGFILPHHEMIKPWKNWTFWQYSEGKGSSPTKPTSPRIGKEEIDLNFYNGIRSNYSTFFQKHMWECKRT